MSKPRHNNKNSFQFSIFHSSEKYNLLCQSIIKMNLIDYLIQFKLTDESDEIFDDLCLMIFSKYIKNTVDKLDKSRRLLKELLSIFKTRIMKDIDKIKKGEEIKSPLSNWKTNITIYMAKILSENEDFLNWKEKIFIKKPNQKNSFPSIYMKICSEKIFQTNFKTKDSATYLLTWLGSSLISDFDSFLIPCDETIVTTDRFKRPKFWADSFTEEEEAYFRESYKIINNETPDGGSSSSSNIKEEKRIKKKKLSNVKKSKAKRKNSLNETNENSSSELSDSMMNDELEESVSKDDDSDSEDGDISDESHSNNHLTEGDENLTSNLQTDAECSVSEEQAESKFLNKEKSFEKPESPTSTSHTEVQIQCCILDLSHRKVEAVDNENTEETDELDETKERILKRKSTNSESDNENKQKIQRTDIEVKSIDLINGNSNLDDNNLDKFLDRIDKIKKNNTNKKLNSVTLLVGDRVFIVRPSIISAFSPIFDKLFQHLKLDNKETYIEIPDVDPALMHELLQFIYTSNVNNIELIAADMWILATRYQIDELRKLCEETFENVIVTSNNVIKLLIIGDEISNQELIMKAIHYISINRKEIINTHEFSIMEKTHPHLLSKIFRYIIAS